MSRYTDAQRKEDAVHGMIERAKVRLRRLQMVLTAYVNSQTDEATARTLEVSHSTIVRDRAYLGLRKQSLRLASVERRNEDC